jgi:formimidoylglutamate deiminase
VSVVVGDDGRIVRVGRLNREPTRVLEGQALLPGFVNAHSHGFQRGLRGQGERFANGAGSFWSWREAMYGLVEQLGPEDFLNVTTQAFLEMRASGMTTVGEFHYFHHGPATKDFGYDRLVLKAARAAQIRLVLLVAYYRTGGVGKVAGTGPAAVRNLLARGVLGGVRLDRHAAHAESVDGCRGPQHSRR